MIRGLNKVMIIGYLGRDPEMRFTPKGISVANFSIAYHHTWETSDGDKREDTEWFNVVAWGKLAEIAKNFMQKGNMVYVEGRLQSRKWQDNKGQQQHSIEIVASDLLLLNGQKNKTENNHDSEDMASLG